MMRDRRVIVMGAGAAGIAATAKLQDLGYQVTLLEASSRLGGRIRHNATFADFPLEMGAEEVHGLDNCLVPFADTTGIELISHKTENDYIRYDGSLLSLSEISSDPDLRRVLDFVSGANSFNGPDWSVEQYATLCHIPSRAWHYLDSRMGVEHGTTLDQLGMKGFKNYEDDWQSRENNYTIKEPYLRLLCPLLDKILPLIRMHSVVEVVDWSGEEVKVGLRGGELMLTDAVICTASVAVLRDSPPVFSPPLPTKKFDALRHIGMGGGCKIMFKFSRRFWPENMYFLHADTFWPQFWNPSRGKEGSDPVLTAFVSGSRVSFIEQLGVDLTEFGLGQLDRIFGEGVASRSCVDAHREDWTSDEFVRGLYSFSLPTTTPEHRRNLAASLGGKVFFAGEATHTEGCSSTVHGAIESGWRAADEIIARDQGGASRE